MVDSRSDGHDLGIPLAEMIRTLRQELQSAKDDAGNSDIIFETDTVELELQVALTRTSEGKGDIKFWVVNAGLEHARANSTIHTFKLTLKPTDKNTGNSLKISESLSQSLGNN